jgi:hypothetical protein
VERLRRREKIERRKKKALCGCEVSESFDLRWGCESFRLPRRANLFRVEKDLFLFDDGCEQPNPITRTHHKTQHRSPCATSFTKDCPEAGDGRALGLADIESSTYCSSCTAKSRTDRAADAPERIPPAQQFPYQSILHT